MPLGIDDGQSFSPTSVELDKGDFVLLYTDGVPDATNPDGEFFGMDRLKKPLIENYAAGPDQALTAVLQTVDAFTADAPRFDDLTLVGLQRT